MRKSDFHYDLPPDLIARHPTESRSASRLLHLDGARFADLRFVDLPDLLRPGDVLVFNDTRVLPARLYGVKDTGGRVEVLVERVLDSRRVLALVRASKPLRPGGALTLEGGAAARVLARHGELHELAFDVDDIVALLERIGHVPLPPYIDRADETSDRERYQTVYARESGAVAAPTAGLHFDEAMLARLDALGVERAFITLHVGAGTFQPLRSESVVDNRLHAERVHVGADVCDRINRAKRDRRRVVAVGTTVVRALETAAQGRANVAGGRTPGATVARDGRLEPFDGETDIFIYPGYRFQIADALLTNFHLPESSLLMLVCAFAGTDHVLATYRHAVTARYRFYSYGDAMFVSLVFPPPRAGEG